MVPRGGTGRAQSSVLPWTGLATLGADTAQPVLYCAAALGHVSPQLHELAAHTPAPAWAVETWGKDAPLQAGMGSGRAQGGSWLWVCDTGW